MPENTPQTHTPLALGEWVEGHEHGELIKASVNSYARHCGPNAIQCAEDDLLGEALDSIIRTYQDGDIKSLSLVYYKLRDLGIIERIEAEQEVES